MRNANMITLCQNKGYVQGTVQYDGSSLDPFSILNGVKQLRAG